MGSSQSTTHTVTIDNDDLSTIQVSKAVANRLRDAATNGKPESASTATSEANKPVNYNVPSTALPNSQFISSLDIQKHVHTAIEDNNKYWEAQVRGINAANDKAIAVMQKEYEKTMREVEVILPHISKEKKAAPCVEAKDRVLKCYKDNPKQSLKCLQEVNNFTSCILDSKA